MTEETSELSQEKRTWSAKISDDLREKLEIITDSTGLKGERLLSDLLESYNLRQTKLSAPKFEKEIENVLTYNSAILSSMENIIETAMTMEKVNEEKYEKKIQINEEEYQKKIQEKEKDLLKAKEELEKVKESHKILDDQNMNYWKENRKLEEDLKILKESDEEKNAKNKEIINLKDNLILDRNEKIKDLKELVVNLTSEVEKNKKYQEEISTLKEDNNIVQQKVLEKENEIKSKTIEIGGFLSQIEFFKDQVETIRSDYKEEMKERVNSIKEENKNRMKELEDRLEKDKADKDREIYELKKTILELQKE